MIIIIHFYNYYIFFCSDTSNNLTASMENNHSKQGIVNFSSRLRPGPLPILNLKYFKIYLLAISRYRRLLVPSLISIYFMY